MAIGLSRRLMWANYTCPCERKSVRCPRPTGPRRSPNGDQFCSQEVAMFKPLGVTVLFAVIAAAAMCVVPRGPRARAQSPDLVVHEWGTFTSIAGPDGQAVPWRPLTGPSDLPCFVTQLNPNSVKIPVGGLPVLKWTVRMETPVLYFYSTSEQTVRATVRFPQGWISEWYPQATLRPGTLSPTSPTNANTLERIQWDDVRVTPGAKETF